MTPGVVLAVALGAAMGAPVRFAVERRLISAYPWGTWWVNLVGSAILGALLGSITARGAPGSTVVLVAFVGTGFCGSLTTFGGFAAQVLDLAAAPGDLARTSRTWRALGYGVVSIVACVAVSALACVAAVSFTS